MVVLVNHVTAMRLVVRPNSVTALVIVRATVVIMANGARALVHVLLLEARARHALKQLASAIARLVTHP